MKGLILFVLAVVFVGTTDAPTADAGWLFRNRPRIVRRVVVQPIARAVQAQPIRSVIRAAPVRKALGFRSCPNGQCPVQ